MKQPPFNRRFFLRGLLGGAAVTIALPALDIFINSHGTGYASGDLFPKRFGLFWWGNGIYPPNWVPTGSGFGNAWALNELMQPLAGVKDLITVVSGMEVKVPNSEPHTAGAAGILSGSPLTITSTFKTFSAPTIDQVAAEGIGGETRFRSIEFGASSGPGLSFNGPNNINPAIDSPKTLFDRIFGGGINLSGTAPQLDAKQRLRLSVLDAVMRDASALHKRLGTNDRARLDQHLTSVRELEKRANYQFEVPPAFAACAVPPEPLDAYPDINGRVQLREKNRVMIDTIVMALACDQTRVFSNFFTEPTSNVVFPGATAGHHQLTHNEAGAQPEVNTIVKFIMAEFAYFIAALEAVPEGSGTLLDNCVVLGTTDCSFGRTHSFNEYPIILAGSAGGVLKQGYHHRSSTGENTSKVHVTLLNALGIPATSFGNDAGQATSNLPGILA